GGAHPRRQRPHRRRGAGRARRPRQGAEERARRERGALGARRRRQERALRVGAPGLGRAAQAGNPAGRIAGPRPAMSTLAYFGARPDYALGRAFLLAFAVHAVLLAFMFIGVRMQNRPGDTVTVELWEAPPPPPPPVVVAPKPPPPAPKVEAPKPEPEPEVKKPDIVEKAPPPKPKPKPKPEAKAPPKDDLEKLLLREQVAMEQEKLNEERRQI